MILEKEIGETPLSCTERWRTSRPDLIGVPLSYAGRLDPMASGKLLILIGEECKQQATYHGLDKEYEFSILFDVSSDSQDVLGRIKAAPSSVLKDKSNSTSNETVLDEISIETLVDISDSLVGPLLRWQPLSLPVAENGCGLPWFCLAPIQVEPNDRQRAL